MYDIHCPTNTTGDGDSKRNEQPEITTKVIEYSYEGDSVKVKNESVREILVQNVCFIG